MLPCQLGEIIRKFGFKCIPLDSVILSTQELPGARAVSLQLDTTAIFRQRSCLLKYSASWFCKYFSFDILTYKSFISQIFIFLTWCGFIFGKIILPSATHDISYIFFIYLLNVEYNFCKTLSRISLPFISFYLAHNFYIQSHPVYSKCSPFSGLLFF